MEHLRHIKNRVIAFEKGGRTIVYVKGRYSGSMFDWQRRLRIRTAIYGHSFSTYHSEMDFTLALASGWNLINC